MNSRMKQIVEITSKRKGGHYEPLDKIPGTSKVRTFASAHNCLYSKESSLDKLQKRAKLCMEVQSNV